VASGEVPEDGAGVGAGAIGEEPETTALNETIANDGTYPDEGA
jgi:hypothetical protein